MTSVVAGITDAFVTPLAQRAQEAGELWRLPAATVAELDGSGFTALLKPGVLTNCAGVVCVGESNTKCVVLASEGAAAVAVLVSGPEMRGAL